MTYGELELRPLTLIKFNYDGPDLSTSGDAAAPRLTFLDGPRWLFPHLWQGWWSEPHQNRNLWEDGNVSWQRFRLDMIRMHILEPHWTAKRLQIVLINLISNKCSPGVPRYNPPGEKGGAIYAVDVTMDSTFVVTANADGSSARIADVARRNAAWTGYHMSSLVIPLANLPYIVLKWTLNEWCWNVLTCL